MNRQAITETTNKSIELEKGVKPTEIPSLVMYVKYNNLGMIITVSEIKRYF